MARNSSASAAGTPAAALAASGSDRRLRGQPAYHVDGKYSETPALARLAQVGISADQFRNDIRTGLRNAAHDRGFVLSEFMTPTEIGHRLAIEASSAGCASSCCPLQCFRSLVPDEAARIAWYARNGKQFETPESVVLNYVEGSPAKLEAGITVTGEYPYASNAIPIT